MLLAFLLLLGGQVLVAPAASASTVDGEISRSEILARANFWVSRNVPYNQGLSTGDIDGRKYRQDCSGFVSMAWHLPTSASTRTLSTYGNRLSSLDQLQPGDMLLDAGTHSSLFVGWNNSSHTSATIWHESTPGVGTVAATWTRATMGKYVPYSYKKVVGDTATNPNPGILKREVFESASSTGWSALPTGIAGEAVASITMDGVKYIYTVNDGIVYEAASNNNWKNLSTQITSSGGVAAIAIDGVKYVYTVNGGQVYEAASNNSWKNLNSGIPTSGPVAVTSMGGVKYVYTVNGGQVYEAASNNSWKNLNSGIPTSGPVAVTSMGGVKYVYTVNGGQVYEAASNNSWKNLNSGIPSRGPLAATSADGVNYVYTVNGGQVYEAASNNSWKSLNSGIFSTTGVAATEMGGIKYVYTM
ncbi:hypothetical protein SANBI_001022 [Sanguibacter sp. 4.1]|uniref:NlpC/P60 domain-containing protein n=1 Tax=Sanguibacter biliveldensis TaxID=3030830 RepID=A0AAF0Z627_9MICO|nr:hypothetical protein [Sanguibacter sp. 4.1]WPF83355.1 hypothetical protein SANBI_001022 [Sanguibacter sp. 4.1]